MPTELVHENQIEGVLLTIPIPSPHKSAILKSFLPYQNAPDIGAILKGNERTENERK